MMLIESTFMLIKIPSKNVRSNLNLGQATIKEYDMSKRKPNCSATAESRMHRASRKHSIPLKRLVIRQRTLPGKGKWALVMINVCTMSAHCATNSCKTLISTVKNRNCLFTWPLPQHSHDLCRSTWAHRLMALRSCGGGYADFLAVDVSRAEWNDCKHCQYQRNNQKQLPFT